MKHALTHWQTTVAGLIPIAGLAFLEAVRGGVTLNQALIAAGVAVLGTLAHDAKPLQGDMQ